MRGGGWDGTDTCEPIVFTLKAIVRNMNNILSGTRAGASKNGEVKLRASKKMIFPGQLPPSHDKKKYEKINFGTARGHYYAADDTTLDHFNARYNESPDSFTQTEIIRLFLYLIIDIETIPGKFKFHFYGEEDGYNFQDLFSDNMFKKTHFKNNDGEYKTTSSNPTHSLFQANAEKALELYTYLFNEMKGTVERLDYAKDICNNRLNEGTFINESIDEVRTIINNIIAVKSEDAIYNSPYFIEQCLTTYCPDKKDCFITKENKKTETIKSLIIEDIWKDLQKHGKGDNYTINDFYKEVLVSVFCVLNISRVANNPPPTPYFDINKFIYMWNKYKNNKNTSSPEEAEKIFDLLIDIFDRLDEFGTNKLQVDALKDINLPALQNKLDYLKKDETPKEKKNEIVSGSGAIDDYMTYVRNIYQPMFGNKTTSSTRKQAIRDDIREKRTKFTEYLKNIIPLLQKKITWVEQEQYKADPQNKNVKVSVDTDLLETESSLKVTTQERMDSDMVKKKIFLDSFVGEEESKIDKLIKSIEKNNAASAIGTMEYIDKLSKFQLSDTVCYYNPTNDYNVTENTPGSDYLGDDNNKQKQEKIEKEFTEKFPFDSL